MSKSKSTKKPVPAKKPALDRACRCGATMVDDRGGLHCPSCKAFRNIPHGG